GCGEAYGNGKLLIILCELLGEDSVHMAIGLGDSQEADYPLDRSAQMVRWTAVVVGFAIGYYVPGQEFGGSVRIAGAFLALGFLCWPNFAYHLSNLFRANVSPDGR